MLVVDFVQWSFFAIFILVSNCQRTHENYKTALFAKPDTIQKAEEIYKIVSQNVSTPTDKAVENILKWLQMRYKQRNRTAREESIINMRNTNYTMKPQPFAVTQSLYELQTGYPNYNTYPSPQFFPYNQTQYITDSVKSVSTSSELPYTYFLPDSQNPDIETTDTNNFISMQGNVDSMDVTITPIPINDTFTSDENSINELETTSHQLPHIHSIDVQCSKDRMTITVEFNEMYNGIIYSKGFYNNLNCHYVKKDSGQVKYSFVVQLNSCGTQFVDEFYKGKQAFLENVLVLQNEPGIQEVWDTVRSVRCLWEGNIKQTLSAGLNVETLNQDILTFSGDMIAARLEIQVGKGPNAPAANGLVKIGDTMTLVVTVDGDSAFDILIRSCSATDGNPNSGNLIQLTDDQGCILKPKIFGNFQMIKNPDPNRPSVVAFTYFQAFKFPDIMDLLIECNVELCKSQCQSCNQQPIESVRQKRLVKNINANLENTTKFLSEKLHVISADDIKFVSTSALNNFYYKNENQVCFSETTFYLQNIIICIFFFTSLIVIISFWIKMKKLTVKSQIL